MRFTRGLHGLPLYSILTPGQLRSLMIANGTYLAPGTARNVAISDGTDWLSRALVAADIPVLGAANLVDYFRQPVRAVAVANQNIASPGATQDSVTLSNGDRILLTAQSTGSQNGIWVFNGASSPLTRPVDYPAGSTVFAYYGLMVYTSADGAARQGTLWMLTTSGAITIDSTPTAWTCIPFNLTQSVSHVLLPTYGGSGLSDPVAGSLLMTNGASAFISLGPDFAFLPVRVNAAADAFETGQIPYILLEDQKTQNTNGGTFTSGSYQTRTLNTEVIDTDGLCSLSSNQITLAAGTYEVGWEAPASLVNQHQTRLYNVTDAAVIKEGTSRYANSAGGADEGPSTGHTHFTIAASKALELQHKCATTATNTGFGIPANFSTEVYSRIWFRRVA